MPSEPETIEGQLLNPLVTPPVPAATSSADRARVLRVLECPVCMEVCTRPVLQCQNGHIVCNKCRVKLNICPLCKSHNIKSYRNLVAEEIGSLFLVQVPEPEQPITEPPAQNPVYPSASESSSLSGSPLLDTEIPSTTSVSDVSLHSYNLRSRRVHVGPQPYNYRPAQVSNSQSSVRVSSNGNNSRDSLVMRSSVSERSRALTQNPRAVHRARNPLNNIAQTDVTIDISNHRLLAQQEELDAAVEALDAEMEDLEDVEELDAPVEDLDDVEEYLDAAVEDLDAEVEDLDDVEEYLDDVVETVSGMNTDWSDSDSDFSNEG